MCFIVSRTYQLNSRAENALGKILAENIRAPGDSIKNVFGKIIFLQVNNAYSPEI